MRTPGSGRYPAKLDLRMTAVMREILDRAAVARGVTAADLARRYIRLGLERDGHWPEKKGEQKGRRKS